MADQYRVVDLAGWTRGETEPGGAEEKRWFRAPDTSQYDGHWLFKPRRIKDLMLSKERCERGDIPDRLTRGEDWAEQISYELARLIDVPAAHTELATVVRRGTDNSVSGSKSLDMRPPHWGWTSGAALLAERDNEFDSESCRGHTIKAVFEAMTDLRGPVGTAYEDWPAFDVFAGYLVLDAWIANSDRHAYNWGWSRTLRPEQCASARASTTDPHCPAGTETTTAPIESSSALSNSGVAGGGRSGSTAAGPST
ncbi:MULTISPECIES: hypothetical protein [unclassified Rhodococcus (in: high G+C Gram-positive bacteria)]|uniref:hypothetical protein n=1 Tax=unclassified Rhodococcus (in: high G+C Gram-positive bacteria) TaxID=192944 RepID=UPI0021BECF14|nr:MULTISPECIES: hypothetical protein [unclassified Rhodococcus (in: high G+C Gram-positive bacteria)]